MDFAYENARLNQRVATTHNDQVAATEDPVMRQLSLGLQLQAIQWQLHLTSINNPTPRTVVC